MSISSILSSGLSGIQSGSAIANRAGGRIAQAGATGNVEELANSMIELRTGEFQVKFGANVVKVADEILGSLIDIRV